MDKNPHLKGTPEEFITANMNLANQVGWEFYLWVKNDRKIKFDKDDFISIAYMGLLKAYKKYNPTNFTGLNGEQIKFSTFAVPTIRGELMRQVRDYGHLIRRHRKLGVADVASVDEMMFDDEKATYLDVISGTEHIDEKEIILKDFIGQLGPRLKKIYHLRCMGLAQEQIGEIMGLTQVSIGRMERHLFDCARKYGKDEEFTVMYNKELKPRKVG